MKISPLLACAWLFPSSLVAACSTAEPTSAVLSNEYPAGSEADSTSSAPVYKGWWAVAQFPEPVPAGQVSDSVRVVPGKDYGYALLAPGWAAESGSPPSTLIALRSAQELSVARGELLTFVVSAQSTRGDCRAGDPLSQEEADFITERIFPVEFSGVRYDAARCSSLRAVVEDGSGGEAGAR